MIKHSSFTIKGYNSKPIIGDISFNNNPDAEIVLFVHGFKGFKDWGAHHLTARYFAEKEYRFVKFNLSHNGVKPDNLLDVTDLNTFACNTISMELFDLNAVLDYLAHTFGAHTKINLIGHSRGGGLCIVQSAKDKRINKLITWSAITDFSSLWKKEQEEEWLQTGQIFVTNARTKEQMPLNKTLLEDFNQHKEAYNILNAAKHIHIPWLIVQGDEDVNVPFENAQKLANAGLSSRLVKIEGANHVYGASHPYNQDTLPPQLLEVCEECLKFLRE